MALKCVSILNGVPINTEFEVLPCSDPPAIRVVVEAGGRMLVDKILSDSQEFPVVEDVITGDITLDQLDGAIGLKVHVHVHVCVKSEYNVHLHLPN